MSRLNKDNETNSNNRDNSNNDNSDNSNINSDTNNINIDNSNSNIYTDKQMWQTVKTLTNNNKQNPPRIISYNNIVITKLKEICNIANNYFIQKINNIRDKFTINHNITLSHFLPIR